MKKRTTRQRVASLMAKTFHPPSGNLRAWINEHQTVRGILSVLLRVIRRLRKKPLTNDDMYAIIRKSYQLKGCPLFWVIRQVLGYCLGVVKEDVLDKLAPIWAKCLLGYKFLKWVFTYI